MSDNAQKPPAFIFGARPVTVESDVKFKSVTGIDVDITCQFKYRDRKEFAELWDSLMGQKVSPVRYPDSNMERVWVNQRIALW